ncbi:MAG: right-handed parallel beta-helix repeat-containing protein [Planctomycetota bacterium]|nr:MAG: right-handed parallel beta-helix repeat-containing protein [Planctomycetota bacterium]
MNRSNRKVALCLLLAGLLPSALAVPATAQEGNATAATTAAGPEIPGTIEDTGTHFEVTDSDYLNITLQSSQPVHLILESVPQMVIIDIEAAEQATEAQITLGGFEPSTDYYQYEDSYHNGTTITTDASGGYTYTQDLLEPHLVFIQPRPSTIFLPGDTSIGVWDPCSRTYTLTSDVSETIQIDEDNLTLDGAGYTVTGSGSGHGVYLYQKTGVTISNLDIQGFTYGLYVFDAMGNSLSDNICSNNYSGAFLRYSTDSTLTTNTFSNNYSGIYLYNSSSNTLTSNTSSNNNLGIYLYYNCNNNSLSGNTTNSNSTDGIYLYNSTGNSLSANISNWNNNYGIYLYNSSTNTLTDNIFSNNYIGIYLYYNSSSNVVTGSTSSDNYYGIYLYYNSNNNEIYNNNFIDNGTQAYAYSVSGNHFNLPEPTGGNHWSNWTAPDADSDRFVDNPFVFTDGQDNLPWVRRTGWINQLPVADAGPDQTVQVGTQATLDGSGSSDPDEDYPLTYSWQIVSKPAGSTAVLSDHNAVAPSFTADMLDDYTIELIVTDNRGGQSPPDYVLVSTFNTPPVADAGPDQAIIEVGTTVQLDGTQSYDAEGDDIAFFWTITQKPVESITELSDPCSPIPTFVADIHGDYVITLVVTDIFAAASDPDSVTVGFDNVKPVADPGPSQAVITGDTVLLDGSASSDANGDLLTYSWAFTSVPPGSTAVFADPTSPQTSFVPDEPGLYVVSLVVNDGFVDSNPANITVEAISGHDAVVAVLFEGIDAIHNLDPEGLKNKNVISDSMINKITTVLNMIEQGRYQSAMDKLERDLLDHIDGCANTGSPDKNDWVITCEGQAEVYPLILQAIELLQHLVY